MTDAERGDPATVGPQSVGARLRAARERQDLSLAEVAARTRVPLRHLEAIESGNYEGLPSSTYAVGFVRAYARAVGEDEVPLARDVRDEVSRVVRTTPAYQPYEIADPTRVPSRGLVIAATGVGLAIAVLAILWFASGLWRGSSETTPAAQAPSVAVAVPAAAPSPAAPKGGQVTIAARDKDVWMRVYDAQDKTLYLGTLKPGEKFDVPPDAQNPMINVGRPDELTVTLNGSAVAPLGDGKRAIKDVPVGAAALAARASGAPAPVATPSSTSSVPAAFAPARRAAPRTRSDDGERSPEPAPTAEAPAAATGNATAP